MTILVRVLSGVWRELVPRRALDCALKINPAIFVGHVSVTQFAGAQAVFYGKNPRNLIPFKAAIIGAGVEWAFARRLLITRKNA